MNKPASRLNIFTWYAYLLWLYQDIIRKKHYYHQNVLSILGARSLVYGFIGFAFIYAHVYSPLVCAELPSRIGFIDCEQFGIGVLLLSLVANILAVMLGAAFVFICYTSLRFELPFHGLGYYIRVICYVPTVTFVISMIIVNLADLIFITNLGAALYYYFCQWSIINFGTIGMALLLTSGYDFFYFNSFRLKWK